MWSWRCGNKLQRLELELQKCRGKLNPKLKQRLCRLDALELAQLLLRIWPSLADDSRRQMVALVEENGFMEAWARLLQKGKSSEKVLLATVLEKLAIRRAVAPLLSALGDTDTGVQLAAAAALARIADPRSIEPLLIALEEPLSWPPARVAEILVALSPASIPPLVKLLQTGSPDLRVRAVTILGLFKDSRVLPALEECLYAGPIAVREAAATALGEIGSTQAIYGLKRAAADPANKVRAAAIKALGRLGGNDMYKFLEDYLTDSAPEVRMATAAALCCIGGEK